MRRLPLLLALVIAAVLLNVAPALAAPTPVEHSSALPKPKAKVQKKPKAAPKARPAEAPKKKPGAHSPRAPRKHHAVARLRPKH